MTLKEAYSLCHKEAGETDGRILFEYCTGKTVSDVFTHPKEETAANFEEVLKRLQSGEPIQYIVGSTEFMSLPFFVTPDVLIPRQDTEILVEWAMDFLKDKTEAKALDLCTGSGCIAISIAKYTGAQMVGVDISKSALQVAEKNGEFNHAAVSFLQADALAFSGLEDLDLVVSNPPYIESAVIETLAENVKNFEPRLALDGGADGLDFYGKIAENAYTMLKTGGMLAVEIGYNQGQAVSEIFEKNFKNSAVLQDLCGKDRVVYSYKLGKSR